jgi:hypothetical protein
MLEEIENVKFLLRHLAMAMAADSARPGCFGWTPPQRYLLTMVSAFCSQMNRTSELYADLSDNAKERALKGYVYELRTLNHLLRVFQNCQGFGCFIYEKKDPVS